MLSVDDSLNNWLREFRLHEPLHDHTLHVLKSLPQHVLSDITSESPVRFSDYEPSHKPFEVIMLPPSKGASRSVVLKRTVLRRPVDFIRWVIAHEIAHAHLHNKGRFPGDDPEHAADALAADWGFPRPHIVW